VSTDTVSEIAAGLQQDADMLASMYDLPSEEGGNGNEADQGDQGGTQKPMVAAPQAKAVIPPQRQPATAIRQERHRGPMMIPRPARSR
jgi:hypothetical protein